MEGVIGIRAERNLRELSTIPYSPPFPYPAFGGHDTPADLTRRTP